MHPMPGTPLRTSIRRGRLAEEKREMPWLYPARSVQSIKLAVQVGEIRLQVNNGAKTLSMKTTRIVRAKRREIARALLDDSQELVEFGDRTVTLTDRLPSYAIDAKEEADVRLIIEITAPPGLTVSTSIIQGETNLQGDFAYITCRSESGPVRLKEQKIRKSAVVTVGTGNVEMDGTVGDLTISVNSGDIKCDRITLIDASQCTLQTQRGILKAVFTKLPKTELLCQSGSGDVTVQVPGNSKMLATVLTANGKARCAWNIPKSNRALGDTGAVYAGLVNGGGTTVQIQTAVGNATLDKT